MWRNPLAYGHATATRIFAAEFARLTAANHMESFSGDSRGTEAHERDGQCEQARGANAAATIERVLLPTCGIAFRAGEAAIVLAQLRQRSTGTCHVAPLSLGPHRGTRSLERGRRRPP